MKITIGPISDPADRVTLVDGWATNNPHISQFKGDVYGLEENGLDGWFDSIKPRVDISERPGNDGAYWPARSLLSPRIVTIRGFMYRSLGASVLDVARFRDRLNAWLTQPLEIVVDADNGLRRVTGVLSDQIIQHVSKRDRYVRFSLIVTCPDPLKYGAEVRYAFPPETTLLQAGWYATEVWVENVGTAPTWPVFTFPPKVAAFEVWDNNRGQGKHILWGLIDDEPPAYDFRIRFDSQDGYVTPLHNPGHLIGQVVTDDFQAIQPGRTYLHVEFSTEGGFAEFDPTDAAVTIRPAWY